MGKCRSKGLNGSPTYDTLGFELDKEYIIKQAVVPVLSGD